jgi:FkbM family methyltransferase
MKNAWSLFCKEKQKATPQKPAVFTRVPGLDPIELVAYYDEFAAYYPDCELKTKEWFVQNIQKDWVILDCGANIGYYTILFATLAAQGHVYAFEPTTTYDMLLANLAHYKITNATPLKMALGKNTGMIEDSIFRIWGQNPEKMEYSFTTIDDFVAKYELPRLDCIKIDVDSFDFEVLQGARETLVNMNPFVVVELNHALSRRNQSVPQVLEWLAGLGYSNALCLEYENFVLKRDFQLKNQSTQNTEFTLFIKTDKSS